jgi:hypothetical protein
MSDRYRPKSLGHKGYSAPGDRVGLAFIALQLVVYVALAVFAFW